MRLATDSINLAILDAPLAAARKWHQQKAHAGFNVRWEINKTKAVRNIEYWFDSQGAAVDGNDVSTMCNIYARYAPADKSATEAAAIPFKSHLRCVWGEIRGYVIGMVARGEPLGFVPLPGDPAYAAELAKFTDRGYGLHAMEADGFCFEFGGASPYAVRFNEHGACLEAEGDHGRGFSQGRYLAHLADKRFLDLAFCRLDEVFAAKQQED